MSLRAPTAPSTRRLRITMTVSGVAVATFAVLLGPVFSLGFRESVSSAGLLLAGGSATVSGAARAWTTRGSPAGRPWMLLSIAGVVTLLGNVWTASTASDPVSSPSLFANGSIAVALTLSVIALVTFPSTRQRGYERMVMFLDGLVAGGAFLLIASVLVYSKLLNSPGAGTSANRVFELLFPALDVLLATFAVLLVVRASRADRRMLALVATAFLLYAASDLAFAVHTAEGTFHFGTLLDLGWIAGYLTLGVAAWAPTLEGSDVPERTAGFVDTLGTTLVFSVLLAATLVQVLFGESGDLEGPRSALWVVIVVAAGARQLLLTIDNSALRRGLERRVEEQTYDLRRLARQNEVLITSVGDGVYGVTQDGIVTFANPSAAALLGCTTEQLVGSRAHDLFHGPDQDGSAHEWAECYIHAAISHGELALAREDNYRRSDGTVFPVELTASPLMDDVELRGAVVVFRDVTQRREVDRMKNEFLSVVSHELRTPLTSIQGSLGLLAGGRLGELPQRAAPLVDVALRSSERLTRLINDLLDIERLQSGNSPLEVSAHPVRHLLDAAVVQMEGVASSMGVGLEIGSTEGWVLADDDQILQTLLNVIGNAVKFSDPGSVVRLDARPQDDRILFSVKDDGRGIPADKLDLVFDRFEQVDSSDTRQRGGTGLGLTISRGIVRRHGGEIWAESQLGVGTTIYFTLPRPARLVEPGLDVPTPDPRNPASANLPVVLVCDDDAAIVNLFCTLLRAHGYEPLGVTDGERAIELARLRQPRAVVLDLMMPGTTGAQVVAALRAEPSTSHLPVVVISGLGPDADPLVAQATEGWLVKPVTEERLVSTVSAVVSARPVGGSVLIVEDDLPLARLLATMLADLGLRVAHAASAAEAVALGPDLRPDVMVLDLALPDGHGSDVVAEFSRRWSLADTALVVYSAAEVEPARREELNLGRTVFLTKARSTPQQLRDQVLDLMSAVTSSHRSPQEEAVDGGSADPAYAVHGA